MKEDVNALAECKKKKKKQLAVNEHVPETRQEDKRSLQY